MYNTQHINSLSDPVNQDIVPMHDDFTTPLHPFTALEQIGVLRQRPRTLFDGPA